MNQDSCNCVGGGGCFNHVISLKNLFSAWKEFRRGKLSKLDVLDFERKLEDNIFQLHYELSIGIYNHSKYTPFFVTDPKVRHIHKAIVRDRVIHHALFRVLYPLFDSSFIYDSYSCRIHKGTHKAVNRLQYFTRRLSRNYSKNVHALKCDISKYFDSIDHKILKSLISRKVNCPSTLKLINIILGSFEKRPSVGIPLGNVTSQLFANIYLSQVDHYVKEALRVKAYLRYCDDFILLSDDKESLGELIIPIQNFLWNDLKLTLHPRKVIQTKLTQGIDFLGYVILPHHILLRTKTQRRMFKRLEKKFSDQALQSYLGLLSHGNNYQLQQRLLERYK